MGPSTLGNRFLTIFVSSPENLANLDQLQRQNATLQDPRGHSQAEIDRAIENGKVVFVQSYGLHSTEVAASQTIAEIIYEMATRNDHGMMEILDNTVAIMIPCFNPDGEIMITDWYNQWVGTEYEGPACPVSYHHYIGHDNNRDAFMTEHGGVAVRGPDHVPGVDSPGVHRPPSDGVLHGPDGRPAVRRTHPPRRRSAGVAGDGLVRRPHGLQDG